MTNDTERRLAAVEQGLREVCQRLDAERERAARARRMAAWLRIGVLGALGIAYYLYFRYVSSLA